MSYMKSKIELFDFQKKVLDESKSFQNTAFYLDMGLGKTFVGSERLFYNKTYNNLVVCQESKVKDWINHFKDHYDFDVYNLRSKPQYNEFLNELNQPDDVKKQYFPIIGIINYEMIWRRKDLLENIENFTLMLDESSLIQSPKSKLTKCQLELQKYATNVILLSGTPTDGKYENLWTQLKMLGYKESEWTYKNRYINYRIMKIGKFHFPKINKNDPYKNIDELKEMMKELGIFFMKTKDVTELPDQKFIVINVRQDSKYIRFKKSFVVETKEKDFVGDTPLTKILYSRMLCGSYNVYKIKKAHDLLQSTNDRLIVFYNFKDEFSKLEEICFKLKKPVSYINGMGKDLTNYNNCENSVTLIQYQSGSMGHDLQKCNKIIYFTLPQKSEYFEQSKKRIHRIGQEKSCFYYVLQTEKSFEVSMLKTLQKRKNFTDKLFIKELI